MTDHEPASDGWVCSCGYDFFGGSAAYSWELYLAHLPTTHAEDTEATTKETDRG